MSDGNNILQMRNEQATPTYDEDFTSSALDDEPIKARSHCPLSVCLSVTLAAVSYHA